MNEQGVVLTRHETATPQAAEEITAALVTLFRHVTLQAESRPLAMCVATAGLVDGNSGRVLVAPNIRGFRNLALSDLLTSATGVSVFVENDANAAALGEHRFGAGRGTRHLLHATLGTGIGGGIVIDGHLYRGASGIAGEIGHIIMDPSGPRCGCGSRGCLEAMASGVAFARRAQLLLEGAKSELLAEIVGERHASAADLHEAARRGDQLCEAEIRHGGHLLGLGLGSLVNVLNPDAVTLSGGLLAMGDMLLEPAASAMHSLAYGASAETMLRLSTLGDDAGLLGAAAVAFEQLEEN